MTMNETVNPNKIARIAGFLYVLLVPLGVFGILYVPNAITVSGDVAATVSNIRANEFMVWLSVVSALLTQVVNIFVVVYLYQLLKPVNKNYAALMVIFILVAVPIAMFNELNHVAVLLLLSDAAYLTAFTAEQLHAMVPIFLDLHEYGVTIAGIFWGLWLFPMGYLVIKSNFMPKIIGIFLIIGGIGYLIDFVTFFVFPGFGIVVSEFTFMGEILIMFWLLIKGVDVEQWKECASEDSN